MRGSRSRHCLETPICFGAFEDIEKPVSDFKPLFALCKFDGTLYFDFTNANQIFDLYWVSSDAWNFFDLQQNW